MSRMRQVRCWLFARRRFQFCLTVAMVVLLTGTCGALLLVPNPLLTKLRAAQPVSVDPLGRSDAVADNDPRLTQVRRTLEPFGQLVTRRVPTGSGQESLVVGHPAHRADIDLLAGELPAATTAVTDLLGQDWAQSVLVVVASNPSEFAALVRSGGIVSADTAAASVAEPFTPGTRPTAQRIVFSADAGRRLDHAGMRALLRHELTHIAARAKTVDGAPQWMLEGFAEYAAHRGQAPNFTDIAPTLTARIRAGDLPPDLPADTDFTGPTAVAAYEQAWSINAFIADKYDDPHLVDLYHHIAAGKQDTPAQDRIIREILGTTRQALVTDWRTWLTTNAT